MKIAPVQLYNLSQQNYQKQSPITMESYGIQRYSPAFKGLWGKGFAVAIAKLLQSLYKDNKVLQNKKLYNDFISNPPKYSKKICNVLSELGNASSLDDQKFTYMFLNDNMPSIEEIKKIALREILPRLNDDNGKFSYAKKDFLTKLFESGEYNNEEYVDYFHSLPDSIYGIFKENIADRILFSTENITLAKQYPVKNYNLYNAYILYGLEEDTHKNYLKKNAFAIQNFLGRVMSSGKDLITKEHNNAYSYYVHDFLCINNDDFHNWRPMLRKVVFHAIDEAKGNSARLAMALNIDEKMAESMIKDTNSLKRAKQLASRSQKLQIFSNRLKEKFSNLIKLPYKWYDFSTSREEKIYQSLYLQDKDIEAYINRTGFADDLNRQFKDQIKVLKNNLWYSKEKYNELHCMEYSGAAEAMDRTSRV